MTQPFYTPQALANRKLEQLKRIAADLGVTPTGNKAHRQTWINAIINHQSTQIQKIAQAELDQHLKDQSQAIAPELTPVQINDRHFEIYDGKWLIAYISYDHSDFITQRWVVMVNGEEVFRHTTPAQCHRYISWHYKDGTLNPQPDREVPEVPFISEVCFYDQEALVGGELVASINYNHDNHQNPYWQVIINGLEIFRDITPARCHSYIKQQYQAGLLPVQEPFEEPNDNRTMAYIFDECERYGLEVLDDGIYRDGVKLGQVGYTDGNWWVKRANSAHQQYSDSVFDAVRSLAEIQSPSIAAFLSDEELLDVPFDELTESDWQRLRAYKPAKELVAA